MEVNTLCGEVVDPGGAL